MSMWNGVNGDFNRTFSDLGLTFLVTQHTWHQLIESIVTVKQGRIIGYRHYRNLVHPGQSCLFTWSVCNCNWINDSGCRRYLSHKMGTGTIDCDWICEHPLLQLAYHSRIKGHFVTICDAVHSRSCFVNFMFPIFMVSFLKFLTQISRHFGNLTSRKYLSSSEKELTRCSGLFSEGYFGQDISRVE